MSAPRRGEQVFAPRQDTIRPAESAASGHIQLPPMSDVDFIGAHLVATPEQLLRLQRVASGSNPPTWRCPSAAA